MAGFKRRAAAVSVISVSVLHVFPGLSFASSPAAELVETASRAVFLVLGAVGLLVILPVVFLVYRKVFATIQEEQESRRDPVKDLARLEKKGDFAGAASLCAAEGDHRQSAALYEKAGDPTAAAEQYELAGEFKVAAGLYLRSGGSVRAASLYIKTGDYLEAAKIFRNKGDHLRAAQALELFGNKTAAAREFLNAGRFDRAAMLFKEEGLYQDAAEAYGKFLGDRNPDEDTLDRFYGYAGLLARAGRGAEAADYYRSILKLKGDYRKAKGNLQALGGAVPADSEGSAPGDAGPLALSQSPAAAVSVPEGSVIDEGDALVGTEADNLKSDTTLRSIITYGQLDPRYSMKIWVQVLKVVSSHHKENTFYGSLSPEAIQIDMQNHATILPALEPVISYTAPEVLAGQAPGPHSDVYALGVILYEMVTGSLEGLGSTRPSERRDNVPEWLDDLIIGCTKKDRRDRYLNLEEVTAELVRLKGNSH